MRNHLLFLAVSLEILTLWTGAAFLFLRYEPILTAAVVTVSRGY